MADPNQTTENVGVTRHSTSAGRAFTVSSDQNQSTSPKMRAAIREGCRAGGTPVCDFPECSCYLVPTVVKAAVTYAITDALRGFPAAFQTEFEARLKERLNV